MASTGLAAATPVDRPLPDLPEGPPYAAQQLMDWRGFGFWLPPGDPRLMALMEGEQADSAPLDNLVGAGRYWLEHPEWMDFLNPDAPNHHDKLVERQLYLDHWERHIPPGCRVLDLGGGVGRFSTWLLDRGCEVELVDPDLRSLWRAVTEGAGRPGKLDVHWSTGECLPDIAPVDVVVAAEVLCYVERPQQVLANIQKVLRPGGHLLCSVEARWGWAMSADVHHETLEAWLTDGVVHVEGDRWVKTYEEQDFRDLLAGFEVLELRPSHYALSGPFEMAAGHLTIEQARVVEQRLREHPIAGRLNRAWMASCRLPSP